MKRLGMISSTMLLGLAAAAAAQPAPGSRDDRAYRQGYEEGARACRQDAAPVFDGFGWRPLGSSTLATPSEKLMVGGQAGAFRRIRIRAIRGAPDIRAIAVRYVDDSLQTIGIRRHLRRGESVDVELGGGGRKISSITVLGRPDRRAVYEISGAE